jgi:hypothetical protein
MKLSKKSATKLIPREMSVVLIISRMELVNIAFYNSSVEVENLRIKSGMVTYKQCYSHKVDSSFIYWIVFSLLGLIELIDKLLHSGRRFNLKGCTVKEIIKSLKIHPFPPSKSNKKSHPFYRR